MAGKLDLTLAGRQHAYGAAAEGGCGAGGRQRDKPVGALLTRDA